MHEVLDHRVNKNVCSIFSNRENQILVVCMKQVRDIWKKEWGGEMLFQECTFRKKNGVVKCCFKNVQCTVLVT